MRRVGDSVAKAWSLVFRYNRILLGGIFVLVALWAIWFPTAPLQLWWKVVPPQRSIFVDSPEVYSRERLINERLSEETWLNKELDAAGDATNLSGRLFRQQDEGSMQLTAPGTPAPAPSDPSAPASASATSSSAEGGQTATGASFDQEFKLRSSYRSLVRQRLIENKLDDRHDLEGNSLYILKFDTTVMNIPATGDRAVVKIRILPPREIQSISNDDALNVPGGVNLENIADGKRYRFLNETYNEWIESIAGRVNARISQLYENFLASDRSEYLQNELAEYLIGMFKNSSPALITNLIQPAPAGGPSLSKHQLMLSNASNPTFLRALQTFFALRAAAEITGASLRDLQVVQGYEDSDMAPIANLPYSDYFYPIVSFSKTLQFPPSVKFSPSVVYGALIDSDCAAKIREKPDPSRQAAISLGEVTLEESNYVLFYNPNNSVIDSFAANSAAFKHAISYAFKIFKTESKSSANGWRITNSKAVMGAGAGAFSVCKEYYDFSIDSGLLSFTSKISSYNTYSYSVLPRESPIAVMSEILKTRSAMGQATGVSATRTSRSSLTGLELRPALTTFGDLELRAEDSDENRQPIVGWVIDPSATRMGTVSDYEPAAISESVLAIISVPAWWSAIHLEVEKTWWGQSVRSNQTSDDSTESRFDDLENNSGSEAWMCGCPTGSSCLMGSSSTIFGARPSSPGSTFRAISSAVR